MSNDKEKINWSELSDEQKQYIIKAIAEMWISHHKKLHREKAEMMHLYYLREGSPTSQSLVTHVALRFLN